MTQRKRTTIDGRDTAPGAGRRRLRRRRITVAAGLLAATVTLAGIGPTSLIEARSERARAKWAQKANRPRTVSAPASPTTTTTTTTTSTTSTTFAPTTTLPVPTTVPPPPTTVPVPSAQTLWHANADTDVDSGSQTGFYRKEGPTSQLTIVNDPLGRYGKVYRAFLTAAQINSGTDRAEWRGSYVTGDKVTFGTHGQELWYGWRSMFGGTVALDGNENDGNYMQLKGDSSCGGPAVGFTIRENRLSIRTIDGDYLAWSGPAMSSLLGSGWHDFVLHVEYGKPGSGVGFLELWLDGAPQAMTNGQLRIRVPTMCPDDSNVFWKLGTYGMDRGVGEGPIHWFESPRIGTTYDSAAPR